MYLDQGIIDRNSLSWYVELFEALRLRGDDSEDFSLFEAED